MLIKSVKLKKFDNNIENLNQCNEIALEQWKTCVEMANSNTEKRSQSNSIFITINTALVAILPFSLSTKNIVLSIIGIVICILWMRTICSYKRLSKVKYEIINEIEKQLPIAPFSIEWDRLKKEENYTDLTKTERIIPWVFIFLFSLSLLIPVIKFVIELVCKCI